MKLTLTLTYAASPSRVGAMLGDADFHRAVCAATGDPQAEVAVTDGPDGARVTTSRRLPTDRLPDAFRSIVGQHVVVEQVAQWPGTRGDDGWTGTVVVDVAGKPVRLDATAAVRAEGGGTTITYDGDLVARVPLMGGRIEKAVEPVVRSALATEERVGAQWLAEHPA